MTGWARCGLSLRQYVSPFSEFMHPIESVPSMRRWCASKDAPPSSSTSPRSRCGGGSKCGCELTATMVSSATSRFTLGRMMRSLDAKSLSACRDVLLEVDSTSTLTISFPLFLSSTLSLLMAYMLVARFAVIAKVYLMQSRVPSQVSVYSSHLHVHVDVCICSSATHMYFDDTYAG